MSKASVYLIPSFLSENTTNTIPAYVMDAVRNSTVIFAENQRTTRRFLKAMDPSIQIDTFQWYTIQHETSEHIAEFRKCIQDEHIISIVSEAGCPGIADPGQELVAIAQEMSIPVIPFVGPNSILLSLMGSGLNGQHFEFVGYLPVKTNEREKKIKEIDIKIQKTGVTVIFIETPYRNNSLMESILQSTHPNTRLCVAVDLTGTHQSIQTKSILEWKKTKLELPKIPVIFLLGK
jgi:16S rRNA (cytidine1402-2'-O)-methyltransferase